MLTKTVIAEINTAKERQVECPSCHHLVYEQDLVPTIIGKVCIACYNHTTGV